MNTPYSVVIRHNCVYVDDKWAFYAQAWTDIYPEGRFVVLAYYKYEYLEPVLGELKDTLITYTIFPAFNSEGCKCYDAYAFGCQTYRDVRVLMNALHPYVGPANTGLVCIFPVKHGKHDELVRICGKYLVMITTASTGLYIVDEGYDYCRIGDLHDFDDRLMFSRLFRSGKWIVYLCVDAEDLWDMLEDA